MKFWRGTGLGCTMGFWRGTAIDVHWLLLVIRYERRISEDWREQLRAGFGLNHPQPAWQDTVCPGAHRTVVSTQTAVLKVA